VTETQRPPGSNISISNSKGFIYLIGDENTKGSIRFELNTVDEEVTLVKLTDGVFNETGFRASGATLLIDKQVSISSISLAIQINLTSVGRKFLTIVTEYDDAGSKFPQSQVVGPLETNFDIQPVFDTEIVSTSISTSTTVADSRLVTVLHLKTGATVPTETVVFKISEGLSLGGDVLFQLNLPASNFPVSSDVNVVLKGGFGFRKGQEVTYSFTSGQNFSLRGDSSNDVFLTVDTQTIDPIEVKTINGSAVSFVEDPGTLISVSGVDVWTDIDDGGLVWALAPAPDRFTLTDTDNGEITYQGLVDCGIRVGGTVHAAAMSGMDNIEIGVSINGAAPTPHTITRGLVTPTQADSVTIPAAVVQIEPDDTLKIQFRNISNASGITFFQAKLSVF